MMEKLVEYKLDVKVKIYFTEGSNHRKYNLPTADEIVTIMPRDGLEDVSDQKDIILRL